MLHEKDYDSVILGFGLYMIGTIRLVFPHYSVSHEEPHMATVRLSSCIVDHGD